MKADEAAWVREHVWTAQMRKTHAELPSFYSMCACQWGACGHCKNGEHEKCAESRAEVPATYIATSDGFAAVIHHPGAPVGAPIHAHVWEAGHRHLWSCPCLYEHAPRAPQAIQGDLLELLEAS